jgi:murein DD-endopeptidase MepM/ murein hydrolase activator NlpD
MRARMAGAFFVGCAAGMLALVVGLWWAGALRPAGIRLAEKPLPPGPGPLDFQAAARRQPATLKPPPSELPQDLELPRGEADRVSPERAIPVHLIVPIAGLSVKSLHDTFSEMRDGHAHEALDIPAPRGTPAHAADEGNIAKLFRSKKGGITVYQFDDSQTYCYYYAHLDRYAPGLREGMLLHPGEVLGYVGTSGDAPPDAPHLHFAAFRLGPEKNWWQGTPLDPLPLLQGR